MRKKRREAVTRLERQERKRENFRRRRQERRQNPELPPGDSLIHVPSLIRDAVTNVPYAVRIRQNSSAISGLSSAFRVVPRDVYIDGPLSLRGKKRGWRRKVVWGVYDARKKSVHG